jgi:hypothetical protein
MIYVTACSKREKYAIEVKKHFDQSNTKYCFVYGRNQSNKIDPFIEVDCEDAYENLPLKTYLLVQHFIRSDEDLLIKINDDTFLDTAKLSNITFDSDYTGMFVPYSSTKYNKMFHWFKVSDDAYKVEKRTFDLSYAEGSFYALSRKACNMISSKGQEFFENTPETYLGEDVKVGMCLTDPSISRSDVSNNTVPWYECALDFFAIHPVHYVLFPKLRQCKTQQQTKDVLGKFLSLNDNIAREAYLNKL